MNKSENINDHIKWLATNFAGTMFCVLEDASKYLIGSEGQLISFQKPMPRQLKCSLSGYGYLAARLKHNDGIVRAEYIHQLVARYFIGSRPKGHVVRHLDGCCTNNDISNIAYGTYKQNAADSVRHGTSLNGERNPMSKLTQEEVREIRDVDYSKNTQKKVAEKYGVSPMTISRAVNRISWSR